MTTCLGNRSIELTQSKFVVASPYTSKAFVCFRMAPTTLTRHPKLAIVHISPTKFIVSGTFLSLTRVIINKTTPGRSSRSLMIDKARKLMHVLHHDGLLQREPARYGKALPTKQSVGEQYQRDPDNTAKPDGKLNPARLGGQPLEVHVRLRLKLHLVLPIRCSNLRDSRVQLHSIMPHNDADNKRHTCIIIVSAKHDQDKPFSLNLLAIGMIIMLAQ